MFPLAAIPPGAVMNPEEIYSWTALLQLAGNLLIATALGSLIAFHPQRLRRGQEIDWEMKKSQVLICVMGVILVQIIRDSLALAFGLVGIGSFIRFRTSIQNPVDGAIIFVQIMIGMACGGRDYWLAGVFTGFVFILISVLNIREHTHVQLWEVKAEGGEADQCRLAFDKLAADRGFHVERLNLNLQRKVFSCRFRPPTTLDVSQIDGEFQAALKQQAQAVVWNRIE